MLLFWISTYYSLANVSGAITQFMFHSFFQEIMVCSPVPWIIEGFLRHYLVLNLLPKRMLPHEELSWAPSLETPQWSLRPLREGLLSVSELLTLFTLLLLKELLSVTVQSKETKEKKTLPMATITLWCWGLCNEHYWSGGMEYGDVERKVRKI